MEYRCYVNFARRIRLPALHFQLNYHILTPTNGCELEDFHCRAQIKQMFEESELVSGDSEAIRI